MFLGTSVPGDVPGNFHAALTQLGDRATYFYSGSGKYWYDLQPNITRTAKDQAERQHKEDVWAEIVKRLQGQARTRGDFAGVHVCPETNGEIPDTDEARLVILHPKVAHNRGVDSAAKDLAQKAIEQRGSANRTHRNMLIYLAADEARLEELHSATRDYLGWTPVLANEADLDLTQNQKNQAAQRKAQADQTVTSRLLQTFIWALVPAQPDAGAPFVIRETKDEGQSESLADRVSRRLGNDGDLSTRQAAAAIRHAISKVPQIWKDGHVSLGALSALYSQYPYMPRLRDRRVLDEGIVDLPMIWQTDAFALATGYDETAGRYVGLWTRRTRVPHLWQPTRSCSSAPTLQSNRGTPRPGHQRIPRVTSRPSTSSPRRRSPESTSYTRTPRRASTASRLSTPTKSRWSSRTSPKKSSPTSEPTRTPISSSASRSKPPTRPASTRARSAPSRRTPVLSSSTSQASRSCES